MNGTEPGATAIAAFENDLRTHAVKALLYNSQTTAALARRMRTLANAAGVPVDRHHRDRTRRIALPGVDALRARRARSRALRALTMYAIELDRVTLARGQRIVLAEVSFAIRTGEFIGVFGPNGAGKTTLLHAILGLLRPAAGALKLFGATPARGNRATGYLPQQRASVADLRLRGREFVASALHGDRWGLALTSAAGRREVGSRARNRRGRGARGAAPVRALGR